MITLEQIRALEARVEKAVALIASLRSENASMRAGLSRAESRVAELETHVMEFQQDQSKIEEGIMQALKKLDAFEDNILSDADEKALSSSPETDASEEIDVPATKDTVETETVSFDDAENEERTDMTESSAEDSLEAENARVSSQDELDIF